MGTKFADFLTERKIDARRVLIASTKLENLRREDREIRLQERKARKSEDPPEKKGPREKPRSGRPVTQRCMDAALSGKSITGPQKTRLLRAINRILEQRKQEPVDLRALF